MARTGGRGYAPGGGVEREKARGLVGRREHEEEEVEERPRKADR